MYKVLIADDEVNVCILIQKLIDWKKMDLELVGIVHNGIDALQSIEANQPDIVISDIRMPGLDGLELIQKALVTKARPEFIIISGYKYFEYAHRALHLGVEHYLLKPIDRQELEKSLVKIIVKRNQIAKQEFETESLIEEVTTSRKERKRHFLSSIMNNDWGGNGESAFGSEYNQDFSNGCFQGILTKVDFPELQREELKSLLSIIETSVEEVLEKGNCEYINSTMKSAIVSVVNFDLSERERILELYGKILDRLSYEMNKFRNFSVTIGIGEKVSDIGAVRFTVNGAIEAIKCRVKKGVNRLIYQEELTYSKSDMNRIFCNSDRKKLANHIESLNVEGIDRLAREKVEQVQSVPFYSPVDIFKVSETIGQVVVETFRKMEVSEAYIAGFLEELEIAMDRSTEEEALGNWCQGIITRWINRLIDEKKHKSQLPVRTAKIYIQEHFEEGLSLEEVAEATNISPAYLSTIFKKETGISFTDYLISCRMEKAKELLKESEDSIALVAEQVGYTDSRYFSKLFVKVVGVKPSVYRKLYT